MNETGENACRVKDIPKIDLENFEHLSEILAAMSGRVRLAILQSVLKFGEVCACEIESATGLSQPTVTSHLRKLYGAGILKKREEWKYTYYSINDYYRPLASRILGLLDPEKIKNL